MFENEARGIFKWAPSDSHTHTTIMIYNCWILFKPTVVFLYL